MSGLITAASALAIAALLPPSLSAQNAPRFAPSHDKSARQRELDKLLADQRRAAQTQAKLAAEIEAIGQDRRKLGEMLVGAGQRVREAEERFAASENKLTTLNESEFSLRHALDKRRAAMAELLAALQRMGRQPPPAVFVRPEDALAAVRAAMLLGAVLPEMRLEAEAIAADLSALVRTRAQMAEQREALARDLAALSEERQRTTLLVEERQKRQGEAERALEAERQRAKALARQVHNLRDLIAKLEADAGAKAREASAPATPEEAPAETTQDGSRLSPAIAFASAKGKLRLPVHGVRIREFGTADGFGGTEKGISLVTRAAANVTAPADGWVVYSGPFRSYGQLLILNAGGGYHVLLAGMERISVDLGQFVLKGEPVGTMGGGATGAAAVVAAGSSQPILYIEFRKDGVPVDPGPWWAATESEKVRG